MGILKHARGIRSSGAGQRGRLIEWADESRSKYLHEKPAIECGRCIPKCARLWQSRERSVLKSEATDRKGKLATTRFLPFLGEAGVFSSSAVGPFLSKFVGRSAHSGGIGNIRESPTSPRFGPGKACRRKEPGTGLLRGRWLAMIERGHGVAASSRQLRTRKERSRGRGRDHWTSFVGERREEEKRSDERKGVAVRREIRRGNGGEGSGGARWRS
ncbi:hypothetical protein KM043_003105 [Ampulex compressa]|nr:hypothetical protein KM043_003105 [Ampulex compressa]